MATEAAARPVIAAAMTASFLMQNMLHLSLDGWLDVPLLGGLFVPGIDETVDDDGEQKNRGFDEVLIDVRDVEDDHGVEHDADEEGAHHHVAHAALATRKPDAADDHHQH